MAPLREPPPDKGIGGVTLRAGVVFFEVVGKIESVETIATGSGIREITQLRAKYGDGRWYKRKGIASVQLADGRIRLAEVHWYEAHGIGKRKLKIKRFLDG